MEFVKEGGGLVDEENGGVIPDAHHNLEADGDKVLDDLCARVCGFLSKIEHGFSKAAANL
jgi:hypothetical protein